MDRCARVLVWVVGFGLTAAASGVEAQLLHPLEEQTAPRLRLQSHPRGTYAGVEPGTDKAPPIPAQPGQSPATVTWPGFKMNLDGTSRVFVQTTSAVSPQTESAAGQFVLTFANCGVAGANNRLPLETRFFNTPVTRVEVKEERGAVKIVMTLRAGVQPRVSSEAASSGFFFVYIDFPAGNYVDVPKPAEPKAQAAPQGAAPAKASGPARPGHLVEGAASAGAAAQASGSAQVEASADSERPPAIKGKLKGKASGSLSF